MPRDIRDLKCGYIRIVGDEEDDPTDESLWPTRDPRIPDTEEDLRNDSKYHEPNYKSKSI
jgi:hypothetical protein